MFFEKFRKRRIPDAKRKKPTECDPNYFYRVFHDKTIEPSGRGFAGSMYKHTIINGLVADSFSIDYSRYISGEKSYIDGK